jgi:hypothetical protein
LSSGNRERQAVRQGPFDRLRTNGEEFVEFLEFIEFVEFIGFIEVLFDKLPNAQTRNPNF